MTDDAATPVSFDPVPAVAFALGLPAPGVRAAIDLLDEGNTVPFIARYRKERTGGLDEVQLRAIEDRRTYLVELEDRRAAILASVTEQGKLTPELETKLRAATAKAELEDLYAPYRPRRKTRASVAREKGLHTCPQAAFSRYQHVVRRELKVPDDQVVICGLALGYADPDAVPNNLITERAPITDFTTWFTE